MAILVKASDIHLQSSSAMGLTTLSPFSVTVWLNVPSWNPGSRRSYVGIYGPATDTPLVTPITAMQIGTSNGAGELTFWTWGGGTLCGTATNFMNAYNGVWVMITYTFDGTTHRGYLNNNLVCSSPNATSPQISGYLNQIFINGYPTGGTSEVADYSIDQYSLYRRELSQSEIQSIYYAGGARHGIFKNLICRYEFDELSQGSSVISVPNLNGSINTLTPIGAGTSMTYTYTNSFANSNIRPVL